MTQTIKTSMILLLAFLLPAVAIAHDFEVDGIYYGINGSQATVTFRGANFNQFTNEYSGSVVIPTSVTYNGITYTVTKIGLFAFADCTELSNIIIGNSVTEIGWYAFDGCTGLTSVTIGNSVTSLHENPFKNCSSLNSVTVANNNPKYDSRDNCNAIIETANNRLISGCMNTVIPNSIKSIDSHAFYGCTGLTSITIPKSINSINTFAFYGCSGLTNINVASDNLKYDSRDNCNAIIETASNTLIAGCMNTIIPESVKSIGSYAFSGRTGLISINIPNAVTYISMYAFENCTGLKNINIDNSVTGIGEAAFWGCTGLTSIDIPNSVTEIGWAAFWGCTGLTSIDIPNSVTGIGEAAFSYCSSMAHLNVACDNPYFDSRDNCNAIIETSNNTLIAGCLNTTISNSVTAIGNNSFSGCTGLTSINIPNSVTAIGINSFSGCTGLTSVNIPNSVTTIGDAAFYDCAGLTKAIIGNSVTEIGWYAFDGCTGLTNVTCLSSIPPLCSPFPYETYCQGVLYVPFNSLNAYQTAEEWYDFYQIAPISIIVDATHYCVLTDSTAMVIPNSEEENNYQGDMVIPISVTYFDIPFKVTGIDANAFDGCDRLTSVEIGDAVETIGEEAFQGCTGLTSVTIGSGVTSIGERAFNYCNALQAVKCLGTVPPTMASSNCFSSAAYRNATLKVHRNYINTYNATDFWYKFEHIEGYGSLGNGDVNGDGEINIADVTTLIDQLLGKDTGSEFYFESADLNYNGHIDIGDVTTLVDLLLWSH